MIVIRVELWSAIDGNRTEIARMHVCNIGGTETIGNYRAETFIGRNSADLDRMRVNRRCKVPGHPRLAQHVWHLVAKALSGMGYGQRGRG